MNIKPKFERVIVSPLKGINTTPKGVIIPDVFGHKLCEGIVFEICGGNEIKIGDKVLYNKVSAASYNLNGLEIDILKITDVMAIICDKDINGSLHE